MLLPLLLVAHIGFAISLLVPSILLPFVLRSGSADRALGRFTRALIRLQRDFSIWLGVGVAATGALLVVVLGTALLAQPWLLLALVIYALNLGLAFAFQRPGLRRLLGLSGTDSDADRRVWRARARAQRYLSYVMATAIGLIAFLMMTKPRF